VVLADGRVWNGLRGLRKDNTGYDLKQVFIGSEGTLGVITAAVLRLFPRPRRRETAWLGVPSPRAAVELLALFRERLGEIVSSFELIPDQGVRYATGYLEGARRPIETPCPWHVLVEVAWALDEPLSERIERVLEAAMERGLVVDGVLAASEAQRTALWLLRENMTDAMAQAGPVLRHDVSVPVSRVPDLVERGGAEMARLIPGVRLVPFGHVGDGNLHFNLLPPEGADPEAFRARKAEVLGRVFDVVESLGGSISAEHGIGRLKRDELARRKSDVEMALMRALKATFDPKGILNPGAVL
jgi:FAD/FMN-containing dehydrogenase